MTSNTVKLTVTYNNADYQFQLLYSKMNWERIMMILQASIPELNDDCIFYCTRNEDVPFCLSGQEDLEHLLTTLGKVEELHLQDRLKSETPAQDIPVQAEVTEEPKELEEVLEEVNEKSVPDVKEDTTSPKNAFQILEDFVASYKNEIQSNEKLSKTVGYLATRIVRWPHENFSAEFKFLEEWLKSTLTPHTEIKELSMNHYAEFRQKGWDLLNGIINQKESKDPQEWVDSFVAILVDTYEKRTQRPIKKLTKTLKEQYTHQEEVLSDLHKRTINVMSKMLKRAHSLHN
ncbi:hypothetical protein BDB01DRAFT_782667 [Pilobolus umbonatus]|nr:hypothetical protein BDB01DRAFT_782667 [Pilobolus umbonatus]